MTYVRLIAVDHYSILLTVVLLTAAAVPNAVQAGILSDFFHPIASADQIVDTKDHDNAQTLPLLQSATNIDPIRTEDKSPTVSGSAFVPQEGPSGTVADMDKEKSNVISVYTVHLGDTLSSIAKMYGVTPNTVLWANDLPRGSKLQIGQSLRMVRQGLNNKFFVYHGCEWCGGKIAQRPSSATCAE